MGHLMLSAAHKSSGKTTITLGLCAALRARGLRVQPFKKGPDYIDPMWLSRAAGRPCYNLDFYTSSPQEIVQSVADRVPSSDIALVEGNKGLYDGLDLEGTNSNAALAKLLRAPVVLVLDVRGTIRGVAPLLIGYLRFDPEVRIAGVILNQVGGHRHEGKLRAVIEHYTDLPVLGAVWRDRNLSLVERHLGLVPSNEDAQADWKIEQIRDVIARQVDLDALISLASSAQLPESAVSDVQQSVEKDRITIGIARDAAFGFYYPDDLEALERLGTRLVAIDLIKDKRLPLLDGLFIGGGFPETHMRSLEANGEMRAAIRSAIENGLPTYAECGGLMYLTRSLRWGDQVSEMAGVLPADTVMCERPQGRGYVRLQETGSNPWGAVGEDRQGKEIAAHEFHYSKLENVNPNLEFAYRMLRGTGVDGEHDGIVYKRLVASYTHLRDTHQHHWTKRFVDFVRACRRSAVSEARV